MVAGIVAGAMAAAVLAAGGGTAEAYGVRSEAQFSPPNAFVASRALTYDMRLVPAGARIEVGQLGGQGRMEVALRVEGLVPGRAYGAHVHQKPCGADPAAAGGHYQNEDPAQSSNDPGYPDPENEVRLDFVTDARGVGAAAVRRAWEFRPGEAQSVVLHDMSGGAGTRVACFTVPFKSPGHRGS